MAVGLNPAQLEARSTGIGGSDAAVVLGISKYKTPYQLFLEKRGELQPEDIAGKAPVRWGNLLEDLVADEYAFQTGRKLRRVNKTLRHPLIPYLVANIDRDVVGESRGLECKTAGQWATLLDDWGPAGTDQIPAQYFTQVQHYCAVTGYAEFDLAALLAGQDFRIYTIKRDDALISRMLKIYEHFWHCVETGELPELQTIDDVLLRFPKPLPKKIAATKPIADAVADYTAAKEFERENKARVETLKFTIAAFMGEHDTLTVDGREVLTFKAGSRGRSLRLKGEK